MCLRARVCACVHACLKVCVHDGHDGVQRDEQPGSAGYVRVCVKVCMHLVDDYVRVCVCVGMRAPC